MLTISQLPIDNPPVQKNKKRKKLQGRERHEERMKLINYNNEENRGLDLYEENRD
jgi:hypothetical protein